MPPKGGEYLAEVLNTPNPAWPLFGYAMPIHESRGVMDTNVELSGAQLDIIQDTVYAHVGDNDAYKSPIEGTDIPPRYIGG